MKVFCVSNLKVFKDCYIGNYYEKADAVHSIYIRARYALTEIQLLIGHYSIFFLQLEARIEWRRMVPTNWRAKVK